MIFSQPFQVVTPTVDGDVLGVLARAEASFTAPHVREVIGQHSVAGVRNALTRLTTQGIVLREQTGRTYSYCLNRRHVAAGHVVGLADAGAEVVRRMRSHIESWVHPCDFAALFGSAATGTMRAESDIDVLVVRPVSADHAIDDWHGQLDDFVVACVAWTGNDTQVLELSADEVQQRAATDRVLLDVERHGIVLAGPPSYLARSRSLASGRRSN